MAAAAAYCYFAVPTFVASSQLLIESQKQQQLVFFEPGMLDLTLDNAQVESQVEILRSERLAAAVVADLGLGDEPELQGGEPRDSAADNKTPQPGVDLAEVRRQRVIVSNLARRVGVRRVGQSYVIELSAWSYRPELAAAIVNAYAAAYLRDQFQAKSQAARQGADWLKERIAEVRGMLNASARSVEDFRTRNDLVLASNGLLVEQQLSEMNSQLVTARAQTSQAAARLERVKAVTQQKAGSAAVSEILNNAVITSLRDRQQTAGQREAELRDRYGPTHEAVVNAHREVVEAESEIAAETRRIAQTYLSDHEVSLGRERNLQGQVRALIGEVDQRRQSKVNLSELEAQADSYRKMYQNLLEKLIETSQKETLPVSSARVVGPAVTPIGKSSPKTSLIIALGGALGLIGGMMIGAVRSGLDRSVRSAADIPPEADLECLGLLPLAPPRIRGIKPGPLAQEVVEAPFSEFSRALRGVKIAIDAAREGHATTTIGIASLASGEGKSSVALNLATLYAQTDCRTLLIDADFARAALTRALTPTAMFGLVEMIEESGGKVWPSPSPNLGFLPLVFDQRLPQSSDLLGSQKMTRLLASLAASYDVIIVDLTAMREAMDARAISRLLDGLILVAAWGETQVDALTDAAAILDTAQAHVFGVVINKVGDGATVARSI